jgi:hypothetical protein
MRQHYERDCIWSIGEIEGYRSEHIVNSSVVTGLSEPHMKVGRSERCTNNRFCVTMVANRVSTCTHSSRNSASAKTLPNCNSPCSYGRLWIRVHAWRSSNCRVFIWYPRKRKPRRWAWIDTPLLPRFQQKCEPLHFLLH